MPYPPGQSLSILSNGLNLPSSSDIFPLVVGYASGLTPNALYQTSDPNSLAAEAGSGPVLESALAAIHRSGGVLVLALAASVAAVIGAVTPARVGSSTGAVTVTGTPRLDFTAKVRISRSGALGSGRYQYTLDGRTYSGERILPLGGSFAPPGSNLTLAFSGTPVSSAVTQSGAGPAVTLSGTGGTNGVYVLTISTGGANGTAAFGLTKDGVSVASGVTVPTTPFTYSVPGTTSQVVTFGDGTHVLASTHTWTNATSSATDYEQGDEHSFSTSAPHYSTSDIAAAFAGLKAQLGPRKVQKVIFTGQNASPSAAATVAATVASLLGDLEADDYFPIGMLDSGGGTADQFRTAFSGFASRQVALQYKRARCTVRSGFDGYQDAWQSGVRAAAERAFESQLSENLGRKDSGLMTWVTEIEHDEGSNQVFVESDKINTFRTFQGETGYYMTNGYLRSPTGSDFLYWDWGLVISELCYTVVEGQRKWLLSKLRALTNGTGKILPNDAKRIVDAIQGLISSRLKEPKNIEGFSGHVSDVAYQVDLNNNFLSSRTVQSSAVAVPLVPVEGFSTTVGLARSI